MKSKRRGIGRRKERVGPDDGGSGNEYSMGCISTILYKMSSDDYFFEIRREQLPEIPRPIVITWPLCTVNGDGAGKVKWLKPLFRRA
jgi:hypothetical protein